MMHCHYGYNLLIFSMIGVVAQCKTNIDATDCQISVKHEQCRKDFIEETRNLKGNYNEQKTIACRELKKYQDCIKALMNETCGLKLWNYFEENEFKPRTQEHLFADCIKNERFECETKHSNEIIRACSNIIENYRAKMLPVCQVINQYKRCALVKFTKYCRPYSAKDYIDTKLPMSQEEDFKRCSNDASQGDAKYFYLLFLLLWLAIS